MRLRKPILKILSNLTACIISLTMIIPMLFILINSLKTQAEANSLTMALPTSWQFINYLEVMNKNEWVLQFFNSLFYATVTVILGILLSSMAAYVLSRNRTRWNRFLYFFIILGLTLNLNHIALMKIMQITHLINTRIGMSLIFTAMQIPFSVFLIYGFIVTVPRDLDEAGIIDGCGTVRLFFQIVFPLLKPVTITLMILNFLNTWNEFVLPLYYLNSTSKWPITIAVYTFFGRYEQSWNLVCADIILTCLPVMIIYLIGQKYIISGMTAGSVKG
ncbi:MAG TPA: carbohydrate ABC transporter permease [Bacillota bacterium]|nr:carbohydrate ABC transporter permease [Bacillota bacterium]